MKAIYTKMKAIETEQKALKEVLKTLSIDLKPYLQTLKEQEKNLNLMKQTYTWMKETINQGKVLRPISKALIEIHLYTQIVSDLKLQQEKLVKSKEEYEKCKKIKKQMEDNQK